MTPRDEAIEELREKIEGIEIAMLTTEEADGTLRSRPMATQQVEFDGDLWFFTYADAPKVDEIEQERHVNVGYAAPDKQFYASVSGTATVVRDRAKIEELWNPIYKVWFKEGKDDPNLALLKVTATRAEYWDYAANRIARAIDFARALVTDHELNAQNEKLDFATTQ